PVRGRAGLCVVHDRPDGLAIEVEHGVVAHAFSHRKIGETPAEQLCVEGFGALLVARGQFGPAECARRVLSYFHLVFSFDFLVSPTGPSLTRYGKRPARS